MSGNDRILRLAITRKSLDTLIREAADAKGFSVRTRCEGRLEYGLSGKGGWSGWLTAGDAAKVLGVEW